MDAGSPVRRRSAAARRPETGINWQNRGCSFSLDPRHVNALLPNKKPFHTLNPALAQLNDGRTMVYGTMGGDGQPQTQAAIFTRYVIHHENMQTAIAAPRCSDAPGVTTAIA